MYLINRENLSNIGKVLLMFDNFSRLMS